MYYWLLKRLSKEHLRKFRNTCFRKFLDIKIKKYPSQLLSHLIRRQCSPTLGDEISFNLERNVVHFGIRESECITGLNCGEIPSIDFTKVNGRFLEKYFYK